MCGIIGYTGKNRVKPIIINALTTLEYRGYDSAGMAVFDKKKKKTDIYKCAGRVSDLSKVCEDKDIDSTCGIGHTRWATHGGVCDANAHPHSQGSVTVVHNGIIENYKDLIDEFGLDGKLVSETDTEVAAGIIDHYYSKNHDPKEAVKNAVKRLKGTFALVIMFSDVPDVIYSIRNVSPIVATLSDEGAMLASDNTALCAFTNRYFVVPEYTILELTKDAVSMWDLEGRTVEPQYLTMDWEKNSADKNGYPFYMEKEIMEQPKAIRDTISGRTKAGIPNFEGDNIPDSIFTECERICVVACGTAMHAGLVFQALVKSRLHMHIDVELASEFMYSDPVIDDKTLVIAVSQSGETIDTLEALKYARRKGAKSLAIINVKGSSIARESDYVLYTNAGPEIAVASTKAYTTQLSLFYLIVYKMAHIRKVMDDDEVRECIRNLKRVPEVINNVLDERKAIHVIARGVLNAKDLFMIGRGLDYSILMEGSLKLKEVSYIHSEAYASGELKHGPIALITDNTPVVALVTQERIMSKELSNIREVRSRGADIVLFIKADLIQQSTREFDTFVLPNLPDELMVFPASIALQLLAYYVSSDKGFDVDKPRNLAKVVTVE
ncbi:MAG: glutamine--fructose-6-phosphate transaminase (isomerizing) [Lachnospiraceae bacterium]|nr:glutamine--fructose-6-phosphate transaminase (isomerizing) [Lachnospiraceae bacterium]